MTAPLTVLMTADAVGGVWTYALDLCRALPDVRFVLATLGPQPTPEQRATVTALDNVTLETSEFRLEWMAGGSNDVPASCRWLESLADRHDADLVHVDGYAQALMRGGRPVVAVGHSDVLSWWQAVHGEAAPPEWSRYRRQVVAGLSAADRVVAPTRAVLRDLQRNYGVRLHAGCVILNGVDIAAYTSAAKQPLIMAAGRVWDAAKNLQLLDQLAADLRWPVAVAGETVHPEQGAIRLQHAQPLGRLAPADLRRCLAAAAIFAAPARYEPFGLAILEAAASGCALVLGDIPSLRENWEGAAVFAPPDEREAWQSAIDALIDDEAARHHLGGAARARAEHLTLAATASRYRRLYSTLAAETREQRAA